MEQHAAMEEAMLSGMGRGRGRASTRGRGRANTKGRGRAIPPEFPFYPTSPFYPTPQMHPTAPPTRVPMPPTHTYQYRPPMPTTSTSFQQDTTDPNPQPYMRAGNQTRQIFRPSNVFNFRIGNTTMSHSRLADLLGVIVNQSLDAKKGLGM
ncbi:hypothetical protein FRX31_002585 [Thalictrum thalictroides]|uniref:Uncharacterized protein n=1 Tax=Thalictrum thalictroides TaxID=46969 RepID=A0A7J6XE49_THATH|nr:hypothetical protein FRX31_002585 [Thalictrum thalictroides]